ncbi:hypothetical protein CRUP_002122 [Coryphaenoides rupestris]|nr:hypothetical protein CRUP_002122 [Coryphaenoides rupestris]
MGLPTLEFSDSFLDSPEFRERLRCHEAELERTDRFIKDLIRDGDMLISALKSLSSGGAEVLPVSAGVPVRIQNADDVLISPLERFRKEQIGAVKADSQMSKDRQAFYDASLQYVFKIQEVQERKKFEFVEPGYELATEFQPYKQQLQFNLQNARCDHTAGSVRVQPSAVAGGDGWQGTAFLNDVGFKFVRRCIELVEMRGSSATPDTQLDPDVWDNKTITSGLKNYIRCLAEPLMTYKLHKDFIKAAKSDDQGYRIRAIHALVHKLPERNREMLDLLTDHLLNKQNLMTIFGEVPDPSMLLPPAPSSSSRSSSCSSSRGASRRSRITCLSSGKRRARLYPPALCLADNDSDTFSSPSTTPRGSQESLSSHSSEKNGLSTPSSPLSSDAAPPASSSTSSRSPARHALNGGGGTTAAASSSTSQQPSSSSICSSSTSTSSLPLAVERSAAVWRNTVTSATSSGSPSIAAKVSRASPPVSCSSSSSSASSTLRRPAVARTSSLQESSASTSALLLQRASSSNCSTRTSTLTPSSSCSPVVAGSSSSMAAGEEETGHGADPAPGSQPQRRAAFRRASSSSSSSSSLFPYRLSASSSLTSLHISEDYKSCHGSVQSLMSLEPRDRAMPHRASHTRSGFDLTFRKLAATNGYQKPASMDAKALYSCEAEHSHELSFPQGAHFSNVCPSVEPGWLQATYNSRTGLIPENYITYI